MPVLSAPDRVTTVPDLGAAARLVCRECGATTPLAPSYACSECFGPLEVGYEFGAVSRERIEAGPSNIWRYRDLLPVPARIAEIPNLEPGCTPLVRAHNLGRELGLRSLWVKDDSANPTHSFKDRVVAVALAAAREFGFTTLACPSTGNLANAVAAAAARAGIRSVVLVPADLEQQKIVMTAVFGGTLVTVEGTYDDVNRVASELAEEHEDWAFVNVNVRPYYAEGSKTLGFEVAEQLGWRLPAQVVIPVASGSQLTKVDKSFGELGTLGLVEPTPYRLFGAQAAGCSPVAAAFKAGHDVVAPCGRRRSRSRSRSATRQTGPMCWTRAGAPAAGSRTSPTRRSSRGFGCWRAPRGSSVRLRAGCRSRCCASCWRAVSWTRMPTRSCSTPVTG